MKLAAFWFSYRTIEVFCKRQRILSTTSLKKCTFKMTTDRFFLAFIIIILSISINVCVAVWKMLFYML